jgi:ATP-dependent RNA helicase DDX19/DBP5
MIAQSQSGTGKTLCFVVAMLSLLDPEENYVQALCITPTLELGKQTFDVAEKVGKESKIKFFSALAGTKINPREKIKHHAIIGTPGKIKELLDKQNFDPKKIKLFILDEADQLLQNENNALKEQTVYIRKKLLTDIRVFLFSATFQESKTDETGEKKDKEILSFAAKVVPKPIKFILLPKQELSVKLIKHYYIKSENTDQKIKVLERIWQDLNIGQVIIFVKTRDTCEKLSKHLKDDKFEVSTIHGKMLPDDRKKVIQDFYENKTRLLISTDALSRGIDIQQVTHVINYDLPVVHETGEVDPVQYLHRIGRSGRFGKRGIAINLISNNDEVSMIDDLSQYFSISIKKVDVDADDYSEHIAKIE